MNLFIVSTFWNCEKYVDKCIKSIKRQYYTNFKAYFIDDKSTDNSYNVAKEAIGDDDRFVLIKNDVKKYKTKNEIKFGIVISIISKNVPGCSPRRRCYRRRSRDRP
mgnify:CR=1 FL=1